MRSFVVRGTAVFLLLVVAYVLISPAFDLDPTANRAWQAAQQILVAMAFVAVSVCSTVLPPLEHSGLVELQESRSASASSLRMLCVNLC